jgi:hypothetical protein
MASTMMTLDTIEQALSKTLLWGWPSDGGAAAKRRSETKSKRDPPTQAEDRRFREPISRKKGAGSITSGRTSDTTWENVRRSVEAIHDAISITCEVATPWVRILVPQPIKTTN